MQQAAYHTAGDWEYRFRDMPGRARGSEEHNRRGDVAGGAGQLLLIFAPRAAHHIRHRAPPKAETARLERGIDDCRRDL